LELLTILYAMLAALTGMSVGDAAPARHHALVASAMAQTADVAVAAVSAVAATQSSHAHLTGRLLARQDTLTAGGSDLPQFAAQIAWIDYGRRHL
jgi:hypothetical protein